MRRPPPPPGGEKPKWVQEALDVPDPGKFPEALPSPIQLREMPLVEGADVVTCQQARCHFRAVGVLQLPSGRRKLYCREDLDKHLRLGR